MELNGSFQEPRQQMNGCVELTPIEDHGEVDESEGPRWRDLKNLVTVKFMVVK